MITNQQRINAAHRALAVFAQDTEMRDEDYDVQAVDLITDLFHLCHAETGVSPKDIAHMAMTHFEAELEEEKTHESQRL